MSYCVQFNKRLTKHKKKREFISNLLNYKMPAVVLCIEQLIKHILHIALQLNHQSTTTTNVQSLYILICIFVFVFAKIYNNHLHDLQKSQTREQHLIFCCFYFHRHFVLFVMRLITHQKIQNIYIYITSRVCVCVC